MPASRLPLDSVLPHYVVTCVLEGARYQVEMDWNEREGRWYLGVLQEDGTRIVSGLRCVADWPLLRKVADSARPPGDIVFLDTSGAGDPPGRDDVGSRVVPLYYPEADLP